jgi:hypothetical protein
MSNFWKKGFGPSCEHLWITSYNIDEANAFNIPPENNGGMCIPNPQSVREVHMVQGGIMKEEGMKQLVFHWKHAYKSTTAKWLIFHQAPPQSNRLPLVISRDMTCTIEQLSLELIGYVTILQTETYVVLPYQNAEYSTSWPPRWEMTRKDGYQRMDRVQGSYCLTCKTGHGVPS